MGGFHLLAPHSLTSSQHKMGFECASEASESHRSHTDDTMCSGHDGNLPDREGICYHETSARYIRKHRRAWRRQRHHCNEPRDGMGSKFPFPWLQAVDTGVSRECVQWMYSLTLSRSCSFSSPLESGIFGNYLQRFHRSRCLRLHPTSSVQT